jgi:AcrR family transcriptional regulator
MQMAAQTGRVRRGPRRPRAGEGLPALPRGPHNLRREEVVRSQRSRLIRAMAEAMADNGYAATTVADVLHRARVSRQTFYQLFSSKQACFMAAYERAASGIISDLQRAAQPATTPLERFEHALGAYLDGLAAEPAFARLYLLEVYAAGPEALARRARVQRRFADLMAAGLGARDGTQRFACDALVAAISAMVTARLAADDLGGLRALREPLTELVRQALADRGPGAGGSMQDAEEGQPR